MGEEKKTTRKKPENVAAVGETSSLRMLLLLPHIQYTR